MADKAPEQDSDKEYEEGTAAIRTRIGGISASHSTINIGGGGDAQPRVVTGPIASDEIAALLQHYATRPVDDKLAGRVEDNACLVLLGASGSGRRTGAVHALVTKFGAGDLIELGANDASSLGDFEFANNTGYILDVTDNPRSAIGKGASLRRLKARLSTVGSSLLILGTQGSEWDRVDKHFKFAWDAPQFEDLLKARNFSPPLDVDELVTSILGSCPTTAECAEILDRIEEGRKCNRSDYDILTELPQGHRADIQKLLSDFDQLSDWVMMTALVMLSGSPKTSFDDLYLTLRTRVKEVMSDKEKTKTAKSDFKRSMTSELESCRAEIRDATYTMGDLSIQRQVVGFRDQRATPIYLEEYWRSSPRALQSVAIEWLKGIGDSINPEIAAIVASRVALIARQDTPLAIDIIDTWASERNLDANVLAAVSIEQLTDSQLTRPLAFHLARDWSMAKSIPKSYSALYAYTGHVGVLQIRQACRVYRVQYLSRPFWTTSTWAGFTEACIAAQSQGDELTRVMLDLTPVQNGTIQDPSFELLSRWFRDDSDDPPLALQLATSPTALGHIAAIVACSLQSSYRHRSWLEALIPWTECNDSDVETIAVKLIRSSIIAISRYKPTGSNHDAAFRNGRANRIIDDLQRYINRERYRDNGPSRVAATRSTKILDLAYKQLNQKVPHG